MDPIFRLHGEATRRAAEGEDILNCTMGALMDEDGNLSVLPSAIEALRSVSIPSVSGYGPIPGDPRFQDAAIRDLLGESELAEHALALATPGGTGAIYQTVENFLEPGQSLLTTNYRWGPYGDIAAHAGRGLETFNMFDADGAFDVAAMEEAVGRQAREQQRVLLVLNFPSHNPTGYSLNEREWDAVADVLVGAAESVPVTVLMDCAYLKYGGDAIHAWDAVLPRLVDHMTVLFAWTASKAFTQYGLRVGALIACHRDPEERDQLTRALNYTSRATWSNCNRLGIRAITDLIMDPDLRERSDAERQELIDLLAARTKVFNESAREVGLDWPRFESGFFVSVFTPEPEVTAAKMRDAGVFVIPINGAVRVALCSTPTRALPRLVEALSDGVEAATVSVA
ncbi:MAG: aminotransferase class I/II-fold pyridoxal phosphate-dependent enzyme [Gemmatimonadota bacterium]|nr:aminotransferase class I/II-fold pyridoxal phosphate-dependent enzyme [Gemmatimonadota bacterium]